MSGSSSLNRFTASDLFYWSRFEGVVGVSRVVQRDILTVLEASWFQYSDAGLA